MNSILYVKKGFFLDTETGRQEIMQQYGSTCYIVHNFDENDMYTFASYLTDKDILRKYYDMTGKVYTSVVMEPEQEPEETEPDESEPETDDRYKQWIADVYHCSEIWGQKMTEEEMLLDLTETEKQKDPGDYSPAPYLFRECCEYWNHLCDIYPS